MKKLILKTALITLASVLGAIILLVTALSLFAPKTMSNYFYGMGNEKLSVWYMEKAYNKSGDIADLESLIFKANECADHSRVVKYSAIFVNREDFKEFAENNETGVGMTYLELVYGNYALSLYYTGASVGEIFAVADQTVNENYTEYNAYSSLVYGYSETDLEFLTALKTRLQELKTVFVNNANLDADLNCVSLMINNVKGE